MTDQISVVIPAYESDHLVRRALDSVIAQQGVEAEIIVTDDSASPRISDLTRAIAVRHGAVRWIPGPRSGVAAENWNHGLGQARYSAKVLLHQDEHYVDRWFLRRALDALARPGVAAAAGGVQVTGVTRGSRFAMVAPLRHVPGAKALLPIINWLGPTGAFVFKGDHLFDTGLVQLVDVEFYSRVLRHGRLAPLAGVSVASLGHHADSITARIDGRALAVAELERLAAGPAPAISRWRRAVFLAALKTRGLWTRAST
jgi:glycosyltransferase involved in cell wall biosynthesis